MKTVQINATCGSGSTGKICVAISKLLTENDIENYILYSQGSSDYPLGICYSDNLYKKIQALKSRIFGNGGFNSRIATKKLIRHLEEIKPDLIHLHNIHAHDCNLEMLFTYIREKNIPVLWTFHDCWAFTANCPHFTIEKCDRWKTECHDCPRIRETSWFFDRSRTLFRRKKELLEQINLTVITPSAWLGNLVGQSFLKGKPVRVIHNGINLDVFQERKSNFRKEHGIADGYMVLGVAYGWGYRKGLDVFIQLSKRLGREYHIVLVGTDEHIDRLLPDNIVSIHRTQNQQELAELYSAADVFFNPTREENYPTVNMEALACETPVVTFDTGGSGEIPDETCGAVVCEANIEQAIDLIRQMSQKKPLLRKACRERALACFDQKLTYQQYVNLYKNDAVKNIIYGFDGAFL